MRVHRTKSSRRPSPGLTAAVLLVVLTGGATPPTSLLAQTATPSLDLVFDDDRVEALFAASGSVSAADLFNQALGLTARGMEAENVVLVAYRLRDGLPVAEYRSDPFQPAGGLLGEQEAVPDAGFFAGFAEVEPSGLSESMSASPASEGIGDPVGFVVRNTLGGPADRYTREVIYAIAVPADASLHEEVSARPVVVFGSEPVTLDGSTTDGGGGSGGDSDSKEALRQSFESERRCTGWVRDYTVYTRNSEGMVVPQYFIAHNGGPECRAVPVTTYMDSMYIHAGMPAPRITPEMAMAYSMLGEALGQGMADEGVHLPVHIFFDPIVETLEDASEVEPEKLLQDDVAARRSAEDEFVERADFEGSETFNGRPAHHYRADGLQIPLGSARGMTWTLTAVSRWVDVGRRLPLKDRWEVYVTSAEQDDGMIALEKINEDFFRPSGPESSIWFPRRQIMRIIGLTERMSEEDQAEVEKTLAEIEKLRGQMEELPPAMQGMLQAQINRLEAMSGKGDGPSVTEAVIDYLHVALNEGPPYPGGIGGAEINTEIGEFFGNTMVYANWTGVWSGEPPTNPHGYFVPLDDDGNIMGQTHLPTNQYIFVPSEISMHGVKVDMEGSLEFRVDPSEEGEDGPVTPGYLPHGPVTMLLEGRVSGSVTIRGESREVAPARAVLILTHLSPTEATGFIWSTGSITGWFRVGHMYCSTAPRALDFDLAREAADNFVSINNQLDQTATTGECPPDGN